MKLRHAIALLILFVISIVSFAQDESPDMVSTVLVNVDREPIGVVIFVQQDDVVMVIASVAGLETGFHGFHIHEIGKCEDTADGPFLGTGGHWNPDDKEHGEHAGDLPSLYAMDDGSAAMVFATDRFGINDMLDDDGTAVIIHSGRDNYANIPERYGGPDDTTLSNGDAGSRVACGEVVSDPDIELAMVDSMRVDMLMTMLRN